MVRLVLALIAAAWALRLASAATSRRRMFEEVTWLLHVDSVEAEE